MMMDKDIPCRACGQIHCILESLPPACLAACEPVPQQEIQAALEKGRREREAFEALNSGALDSLDRRNP
jgi:hypothetical protein